MPEATIYKDNSIEPSQYNIRSPGEFPVVQTKPKPLRMQPFADHQLGFGICTPYCRHVAASGLFVMDVSQLFSVYPA